MHIPFTRPNPPQLSRAGTRLRRIEQSGMFSNFGPVNTRFEAAMKREFFGDTGACLTVCNATIGLMLAIKAATSGQPATRRYALMPAFTFAAAAQATLWCGLQPLFCDIDPVLWASDPAAESRAIARYADEIAVVMPYATFGADVDLARYTQLMTRTGLPVVIDAAASLGTQDRTGRGYGTGFRGTVVFSMHATKSFATGEAGLIYSADAEHIRLLRTMSNFGFGRPRTATVPGLNAKLSEVGALLGEMRLERYARVAAHRARLAARYRSRLPELTFQLHQLSRQAHQFVPALLPRPLAARRPDIVDGMVQDGVGIAHYFSPHLLQQDLFASCDTNGAVPITDDVAARIISLPLFDRMSSRQVDWVAASLKRRIAAAERGQVAARPAYLPQPSLRPSSSATVAQHRFG